MMRTERSREISFRWKLGWHPNDGKPQEARMYIDKAQDGVLVMRNEKNIDNAWMFLGQLLNGWKPKELTMSIDRAEDGIPMMRNQGNK